MKWEETLKQGMDHLRKNDPTLRPVIDAYGLPTFKPHGNYYQELVESIISQQLSVKAAATINGRFVDLFGHFPLPEEILSKTTEELRSAGLSGQKTRYICDLAQRVLDGSVRFDHLDGLTNEQIVSELTAVKGIGEWTVHMFLLFCMGRLDVLAYGDLGVRTGVMRLYGLDTLPDKSVMQALADQNKWTPYQSLVSWYAWKVLDNEPKL
ncbi:MAG TPA: DNA-3-methyladenine glycosylase [Candidatus Saccharimonadales bacterium]